MRWSKAEGKKMLSPELVAEVAGLLDNQEGDLAPYEEKLLLACDEWLNNYNRRKYGAAEETYKTDEEIASQFEGYKIRHIEFNPSGTSGVLEIEFPNAGESVAGGTDYVVEDFIIYDTGKVAFDNWYPEKTYLELVDYIKNKQSEKKR